MLIIQYQTGADNIMALENQSQSGLKFLSKKEVASVFGFSVSTLYRRVDDKLAPPPVKFGGNFSRWVAGEVHAVFNAMVAGKTEDQIRNMVSDLVEQRKQAA